MLKFSLKYFKAFLEVKMLTVEGQTSLSPLTVQFTRVLPKDTEAAPYSVRVVNVTDNQDEDYREARRLIFSLHSSQNLVAESKDICGDEVRKLRADSSGKTFLVGLQCGECYATIVADRDQLHQQVIHWFGDDELNTFDRVIRYEDLIKGAEPD